MGTSKITFMYRNLFLAGLLSLLLPIVSFAQEEKQALDHDAYDIWNRLGTRAISSDGQWVLYTYATDQGEDTLVVKQVGGEMEYKIGRGSNPRFTRDASHVMFLIEPQEDSLKAARKAKKKDADMPKSDLGVLNLNSGALPVIPKVQSYKIPSESGDILAYHLEPEPAEEDSTDEESEKAVSEEGTLVIVNLANDMEIQVPNATDYVISENGRYLAVATSPPDTVSTGVLLVTPETGSIDTLITGKGEYSNMVFDDGESQLAFMSDRDDQESDNPAVKIYRWHEGVLDTLVSADTQGIPDGWWIGSGGSLSFSESGNRLFFGTQPRPEPEPEEDEDDEMDDDDKVTLDIWNWKDPLLQPMQLVQLQRTQNRTYTAVVHLDKNRVVQLAQEDMPTVDVGMDGDADVALANTNIPYQQQISWDSPGYNDVYSVSVSDGSRTLLLEQIQDNADLSPGAQYVTWWDRDALAWMGMPAGGGGAVNLTEGLPHRVDNEIHDWPYKPSSYGSAGWTEDDEAFLVYDKHDIWALDPTGSEMPESVTHGLGRDMNLRFRNVRLDFEEDYLPEELLVSAFHYGTKANGFYEVDLDDNDPPDQRIMAERSFGLPSKAEDSEAMIYTQASFEEFGDLWVTMDDEFSDVERLSDLNPQQSEYLWGTAELVSWTSLDGIPLQGMLFKPENFDPAEQYPMMVYFYEKMSNGLYQHRPPSAGSSSISVSFYVSRGYLVFIPDIPYKVGYPGESALNAVVPGVTMLINQGFVQADNVGVQGHSWGGYQIAYMVTETNLFKAAEAGAPVSNMTSAYGGIRWGTGMSRMFQYEQTQSRIGGSLWEYPLRYIDNSPLFQADKIETPVLMMHNDDDGAVPWYQGIEFFVALRRLGKPVWMLNYNGAGHGLRRYADRKDWTIRMQQFFDHYLKEAPAPVWMEEGVPATKKGKTLGLDLVEPQE